MTEFKKGREKNIVEGKGKIERAAEGLGETKSANRSSGFLAGLLNFFAPKKEEIIEKAVELLDEVHENEK